jgi:hypothetical protein
VRVRVLAVAPAFTVLRARQRVSRTARSVVMRVAASLPSRLLVRGGSRPVTARVGLRPRRLRIPIVRRAGLLRLRLALVADRRARTTRVEIDRR